MPEASPSPEELRPFLDVIDRFVDDLGYDRSEPNPITEARMIHEAEKAQMIERVERRQRELAPGIEAAMRAARKVGE